MASGSNHSAHQALLDLERSIAPPLELLDAAARILGIGSLDGHNNASTLFDSFDSREHALSFAPKEEWVLRWLFKKIKLSQSDANHSATTIDNSPRFDTVATTWALFGHLVHTIPCKNLARVLNESGFLTVVDTSLSNILAKNEIHLETVTLGEAWNIPSIPSATNRSKKRKRSLSPVQGRESLRQLGPVTAHALIIGAISHCASLASAKDDLDRVPSQHMQVALRAAPELASALVGKLLLATSAIPSKETSNPIQELNTMLESIPHILKLWELRSEQDVEASRQRCDHAFTQHCLGAALAVLSGLQRVPLQILDISAVTHSLERLITIHTVHAARTVFFSELSSQWKPDTDPVLEIEIQPVIERLQKMLVVSDGHDQIGVAGSTSSRVTTTRTVPIIFGIAVRSSPRNNIRRQQYEQPWLEALFITLVNICHTLPDVPKTTRDFSRDTNSPDMAPSTASAEGLLNLLNVAIAHKVNLTLPILCYLTLHRIINQHRNMQELLLARVVELDVNVFLPNSGMSSSATLLEKLCELVTVPGPPFDDLVKKSIVLPLMKGFGQARDLSGFVEIWQQRLFHTSDPHSAPLNKSLNPIFETIWEDEDVFSAFIELARTSATPNFVATLLSKTDQCLKDVNDHVGDASNALALIAITDTILVSRTTNCAAEENITQALLQALCRALSNSSIYKPQRWRLWKMLRHGLLVFSKANLLTDILSTSESVNSSVVPLQMIFASRSTTKSMLERAGDFHEVIECFHLLVQRVIWQPSAYLEQFRHEIDTLTTVLDHVAKEIELEASLNPSLWDGRVTTLKGLSEVAAACLGILLQNSQVLTAANQSMKGLLQALYRCAATSYTGQFSSTKIEASNTFLGIFYAFLSTEQVTSSRTLLHHCIDAVRKEMDGGSSIRLGWEVLLSVPLQEINKSHLVWIADVIVDKNQNTETINDPDQLGQEAALLERIVRGAHASVGMPQHWRQMVEFINALKPRCGLQGSRSSRVIACAIRKICDTIWSRAVSLPQSDRTEEIFSGMFAWCSNAIKEATAFDYGVSDFILLRRIINGFWTDRHKLLYSIPTDELNEVRKAYLAILVSDLEALCSPRASQEEFPGHLAELVRSLSKCSDLCAKSHTLKRVQRVVDEAIDSWKKKEMSASSMTETRSQDSNLVEIAQHRLRRLTPEEDLMTISKDQLAKLVQNYANSVDSIHLTPTFDAVHNQTPISAKEFVMSLGQRNMVGLFDLLSNGNMGSGAEVAHFFLIAAVIEIAREAGSSISSAIAEKVPRMMEQLCHTGDTIPLRQFCLSADCITFILHKNPEGVNQWTVDNILGTVAVMLSPDGPAFHDTDFNATTVFERLCSIVSNLVRHFRRRLGGRYHLLVPVMQSLLRCLFAPAVSRSSKRAEFSATLAPWMLHANSRIQRRAALHYSVLLSSICDPTTSSVRRTPGRPGEDLTDETKKAKRMAGEYMQFVVMEYARCQLQGQMEPEMKAVLMPGLYNILDVMSSDVMRAMNAAMDVSSRAIFKGLYDEYQKFGKWNQS